MKQAQCKILLDFEFFTGLGPTHAAKVLGVAYSTYHQYRTLERPLPKYIQHSTWAIQRLSAPKLNAMIREHVYGGKRRG